MNLVRKFWAHTRFRVALHTRLVVDVMLAAAGIVLIFFGGAGLADIVGWFTTGAAALLFLRNMHERWRRAQNTKVVENDDFSHQVHSCSFPEGYELRYGAPSPPKDETAADLREARAYIESLAVNERLDASANPISLLRGAYEVPDLLKEHRARCVNLRQPDFNDPKVGLRTDLTVQALESGRSFDLQRTDYFRGAATNEMACEQFEATRKHRAGKPHLLFAVSDMIVMGGALIDLSDSELSNHIGVTTLVLTADDQIVVQDQGAQMIARNETAVGASGSVDHGDIETARRADGTFQTLLRSAMEREAREELSAQFGAPGRDTVLTGYARYLARGGKPEFFGISRSTSAVSAMRPSAADRRYVSGIWGRPFTPTQQGLIEAIDALVSEGEAKRRRYSLSMVVCLRMAKVYLERERYLRGGRGEALRLRTA